MLFPSVRIEHFYPRDICMQITKVIDKALDLQSFSSVGYLLKRASRAPSPCIRERCIVHAVQSIASSCKSNPLSLYKTGTKPQPATTFTHHHHHQITGVKSVWPRPLQKLHSTRRDGFRFIKSQSHLSLWLCLDPFPTLSDVPKRRALQVNR